MNNHQSYPGDTIDIGSDAVVVPCDFNAVSDSAFIASLKPISDDLQAAHIHLQHDEIEPAKKCVINHFISRSKPLYHFDNRDAAGPKVYLTLDLIQSLPPQMTSSRTGFTPGSTPISSMTWVRPSIGPSARTAR